MPFDRKKYPKDWEAIRARILERAGHKCERCGVPNGHYRVHEDVLEPDCPMLLYWAMHGVKARKIVLTTAHIHNPDPMDCRDENLQALCQRCHNRLDAPMRAANRAKRKQTPPPVHVHAREGESGG